MTSGRDSNAGFRFLHPRVAAGTIWHDAAICLSFANLCFLSMWAALQDTATFYFRKVPPAYSEVVALTLDVTILAAVLFACLRFVRPVKKPWIKSIVRLAFLILLAVPARNVRLQFPGFSTKPIRDFLGHTGLPIAGVVLLLVMLLWSRKLVRAVTVLLLIMAPLLPINVVRSAGLAYSWRGEYSELHPLSAGDRTHPARRLVLLVFDELDYRIAFDRRPPAFDFRELDRLRRESVFAVNALPAQAETILSVPTMLSGLDVAAVTHQGSADLTLTAGRSTVAWTSAPSLFSEARRHGLSTASVGWFHPYCRVLGSAIDECFYEPFASDQPEWAQSTPVLTSMQLFARRELARLAHRVSSTHAIAQREHVREFLSIHPRAIAAAADPALGFVFLHYPIPHPPGIFDPASGKLELSEWRHYADNLPLVDRTLGELRAAMERTGVWDSTVLILTADHPLRMDVWPDEQDSWGTAGSPLVPFMVKLENQTHGVTFEPAMNNRIVHDLALEIFANRHRFAQPEELAHWLEGHSGIGDTRLASGAAARTDSSSSLSAGSSTRYFLSTESNGKSAPR